MNEVTLQKSEINVMVLECSDEGEKPLSFIFAKISFSVSL